MRSTRFRFTLRWLMVGVAVAALSLAGWLATRRGEWFATRRGEWFAPPAAAWLKLDGGHPVSHDEGEANADRVARLDRWRQDQRILITCPTVLNAAAVDPRVAKLAAGQADPIAWLQRGVRVTELSSDIVTITMPGERRGEQAAIVNAVADAYLEAALSWESRTLEVRMLTAGAKAKQCRSDLAQARRSVREGKDADPEQAAEWRDRIANLEATARRLDRVIEQLELEVQAPATATVIARAR